MGLLDIFRPRHKADSDKTVQAASFQTITEYAPIFSTWGGQAYEKALVRSAIETTAQLASKLKPEVTWGPDSEPEDVDRRIKRMVDAPNKFMSWPKMISRLMTILLNDGTAAVVPALDRNGRIIGLFPLKFQTAEVVEWGGQPWVRFWLAGETEPLAIELESVCLLTRFQYESDFFGSSNDALTQTLQLMDYQDQAQASAIKNGAKIQFIAAANGTMRPEDMEAKRQKFSEDNLSSKNTTGLMLYDNTFESVKQVDPQSYTVSSDEMSRINNNVYSYFGVNQDLLQSSYSEETFGAFYESRIEPFGVQLGEGLTQMMFTPTQRIHGKRWSFSANRLEYATNASKRNMIRDMIDRGIMTVNEAREILQMAPIPGGNNFYLRGEYVMLDADGTVLMSSGGIQQDGSGKSIEEDPGSTYGEEDRDLGGDDDIYNDTDGRGTLEEDD